MPPSCYYLAGPNPPLCHQKPGVVLTRYTELHERSCTFLYYFPATLGRLEEYAKCWTAWAHVRTSINKSQVSRKEQDEAALELCMEERLGKIEFEEMMEGVQKK